MKLRLLIAFVATAALMQATPAAATVFCGLKKTKDGFVALRDGPRADAKLIVKMKRGDEVQIDQREEGDWIEVTWWRGDDRLSKRFGGRGRQGWMNRALVDELCG